MHPLWTYNWTRLLNRHMPLWLSQILASGYLTLNMCYISLLHTYILLMPDVHVVYHVSLILCFLIPFCTCIFGLTDKYIDVTICLIFFTWNTCINLINVSGQRNNTDIRRKSTKVRPAQWASSYCKDSSG